MYVRFEVKRICAPTETARTAMRYPAAETAEKHQRILDAASRLFRERGFDGVSVAEIMKATGLTHGPFYNHFASKEALMAEGVVDYVQDYLSEAHRNDPGDGCLMSALGSEVSRVPAVRTGFTAHVRSSIASLAEHFPWSAKRHARRDAIRMLSAMVGAMTLARAVDDEALSEEILREVRSQFK